jgi:hypothetical protein
MASLLAVWGLADTSDAFKRELLAMSERLDMNADDLGAVMSFETGGTFRADILSAAGNGAVGLIQFTKDAEPLVGKTRAELGRMTPVQQLKYVEKYLAPAKGALRTSTDHYMAVFSPRGIGHGPDFGLYFEDAPTQKERDRYRLNKALDTNGDGTITVGEAAAPVLRIIAAAEQRPRLEVPLVTTPEAVGGIGGLVAVMLFILGIRKFKKNARLKT